LKFNESLIILLESHSKKGLSCQISISILFIGRPFLAFSSGCSKEIKVSLWMNRPFFALKW